MNKKPRTFDPKEVLSGFTGTGRTRSILLLGNQSKAVSDELDSLSHEITRQDTNTFRTTIDSRKIKSPKDACSQFARNLRTGNRDPMQLARFAMDVGKSASSIRADGMGSISVEDARRSLAESLTGLFADLTGTFAPKLLLSIKNVDELSDDLLLWFSNELNHAMRAVPQFKNTRFLFSAISSDSRLRKFFDRFGFEQVHTYTLGETAGDMDHQDNERADEVEERTSEFSKRLINSKSLPKLISERIKVSADQQDVKKFISSFPEDERRYLSILSYPARASRYSLEHFVDSRTAALAFNWLKRSTALRAVHESGDLVLASNIRQLAREYHSQKCPDEARNWKEISDVFDLFQECFPHVTDHSLAFDLQALTFYNEKILKGIFNDDQLERLDGFTDRNSDQIVQDAKNCHFTEDAKLVTRRFMEVSGQTSSPGLEDKVRELWMEDHARYTKLKAKLDTEKTNLSSEIEDAIQEIARLKDLKDKLMDDFKNPKRFKPEKVYSFTSSKALITLGLATCGASILFDTLGTYHAACGLAVTIFGFFWPNVELKRAVAADSGPRSNLAIETQQRSLKHRIAGLVNRTGVMKGNLKDLESQIHDLGDDAPHPYLEFSEES